MRRTLMTLCTLAFAAACSETPTAPENSGLELQLRHDGGGTAGLNQVILTLPSGETVITRTDYDGLLRYPVKVDGVYQVRIVPRAGYAGDTPGLRQHVTLDDDMKTVVAVTLYRQGTSRGEGCLDYTPASACR